MRTHKGDETQGEGDAFMGVCGLYIKIKDGVRVK
jgi:hypothetical protein